MSYQLHNNDCLAVMRDMPDNSVSLIIADPPYFRVKDADWDNAWASVDAFLDWLRSVVREFARILQPNGSLYLFAWPRLSSRIEAIVGESLNVLNHLVWYKANGRGHAMSAGSRSDKEQLRGYFATTERIIFAEHYNSDNVAKGEAGYATKCDELRGFVFEPLRAYLAGERDRSGASNSYINAAWCAWKGVASTSQTQKWFSHSCFNPPTREAYEWLRQVFSSCGGGDYLQREYEDLQREYEDLQREYEDLRRPFNLTKRHQWGDVMTFAPVASYPGKHPCEKPQAMLMQFVEVSSRPDSIVLDPFMGSGATGLACHALGREFIGIDASQHWYDYASRRLEAAHSQMRLAV